MVQTINGSQLAQTVTTIEVVCRPLQKSSGQSQVEQNENSLIKKIKELFSEAFFHHYAIILNTTENEQMILHYLQEGFTSSLINNEERKGYTVIERYDLSQFNKLFIVQELYNLRQLNSQDSLEYNLLKNSCIHYVNHVKEYINKYLIDINLHAVQKVELPSLISATKILIQKIFENILAFVREKKPLKSLMKFTRENFLNPNLYYHILYEAIRCGKNQSKMQILGSSIIIAFIYLINQIPCVNLVLSIPVMILYLQFIWIQNDETIFKKCLKTLTLFFVIWLGMLPETQILRYLIDLVSDLIKMFSIITIKTKEVVIIGGCTIVVFIGGAALASQPLAIPLIAASCNQVAIKSCVLIITGLLSRGEPAAISSGAFLLELGSNSAKAVVNCVSDAVVTTSISVQRKAISKICSMNVALGIGVLVALAAGLGICKWLRQKKSE